MVANELPSNASLSEILSARALRTPTVRLIIDLAGGGLIAAAAAWARPRGWVALAAAAACFFASGAWAIAERRLQPVPWPETVPQESAWKVLRGVAAFVGIAAFCLLLFATLGIALGSIVS